MQHVQIKGQWRTNSLHGPNPSFRDDMTNMTNNCIGLHRAGTGRRDVYAIHPAPRIFNESNILWT